VLRYAITDLASLAGDDAEKTAALLRLAACWAADGIDFVQLREKNLDAGVLTTMARELVTTLGSATKLLINSRADVALAAGADGVHLTARPGELTPENVRQLYAFANAPRPVISVSCHNIKEVALSAAAGADLILFAPVFEKRVGGKLIKAGAGIDTLAAAVSAANGIPVLAIGGVTTENSPQCIAAGAAGVAGIRLFATGGAS
jgi:thiamine-phosphate pyrophosphorylase